MLENAVLKRFIQIGRNESTVMLTEKRKQFYCSLKRNWDSSLRSGHLTLAQDIVACEGAEELHEIVDFSITQLEGAHAFVEVPVGTASAVVKLHHVDQCLE